MKNITTVIMKSLCLFFVIMTSSYVGRAQYLGDTITLYVENQAEVKIEIPDYDEMKHSDSVVVAVRTFLNVISDIHDHLVADKTEWVCYQMGGALTIESGNQKTIFINKAGTLTNTGIRDRAEITGTNYAITITTTDLNRLADLSIVECLQGVAQQLPGKSTWPKTLTYECLNGKINELEVKNNQTDYIDLQLGAGAGLIRNKWVTDLSFGIGIGLNHKGNDRLPYLSTNMIFDFAPENKININTFLNAGYTFNVASRKNKPEYLGVEIGYLVSRKGDLFGKNTFKLAFNWSPAKNIRVSPALYLTDNFNQAFPGVRVGFGF